MNQTPQSKTPAPGGITLNDVYFVLFRHKWLILAGCILGIAGFAAVILTMPTYYVSEAKLLVRYVSDTKSVSEASRDASVKTPDSYGATIMQSEVAILTSADLAREVAKELTVEEPTVESATNSSGGATNVNAAREPSPKGGARNRSVSANEIILGLSAGVPRATTVIEVRFKHPDPDIAQEVLTSLVKKYRDRHNEIHNSLGVSEQFMQTERDKKKSELADTEEKLSKLRTKLLMTTPEESRKATAERLGKLSWEIMSAQAELEERTAELATMAGLAPGNSKDLDVPAKDRAPREMRDHYRGISERLAAYRKREAELLFSYNDDSPRVTDYRKQIAALEAEKQDLEDKYPRLAEDFIPAVGTPTLAMDPREGFARTKALQRRILMLTNQYTATLTNVPTVDEIELSQLQRDKQRLEASYLYYESSIEQAQVAVRLGPGAVSNISDVQKPTRLGPEPKKSKMALMALLAGVLGSIGLAFVLELFLDPRIKRPVDVQNKLHLPLFLVIPKVGKNGHSRIQLDAPKDAPADQPGVDTPEPDLSEAVAASDNGMATYSAALRDRLMFYFQSRNMTHKPKLVGVTSCSRSAGTTTIAAGLAAALSETREGNVLLVDMNLPGGVAHPFHRGKPGVGLQEALEDSKRSGAFVQEGLYLASALEPRGRSTSILPRRFSEIMPKLKTSDYDFIIFDMPPVNQTSATAHLAALLDLSFVVLESGKTNREAARRATSMLAESQANIAVILNKARTYVPAWLAPEV